MKSLAIILTAIILTICLFNSHFKNQVFAFEEWGIKDVEVSGRDKNGEIIPKVFISHSFLEKDILKIEINISDVKTPLIGSAFHLVYDKEKMDFLKYVPLNFFEQGGDPIYLVTNKENKIIFGETLKIDDSFPVGQGKIVEFYFQTKKPKPYFFNFENAVLSGMQTVMQDIDEVIWEDYEISDKHATQDSSFIEKNKSISNSIVKIFSIQNILMVLLPCSTLLLSLWAYYIYRIKPILNNTTQQ